MDVRHDGTAGECPHGVAQDIPADRLHDVLHQLAAEGFQPLPFLRAAHAHVGDGLPAKTVLADPRPHIGKPPAGRERDEHHAALVNEADAVCLREYPLFDALLHRAVNIPPKFDNVWV